VEPTEAEVASAIGRLEQSLKDPPAAEPPLRQHSSGKSGKTPGYFWLAAGVIFPALVVLLEAATGFCAGAFFDPLPTAGHALLATFVPASNLLVWLALRKERPERVRVLGWLNGAAIGGAAFFTLVFLPLMPLAALALIFFGLGLLPMAPLFALIASITGRRYLRRRQEPPARLPGLWPGLALTLIVLAAATLPDVMTRIGLEMAASADAAESRRGDAWLRWMGDRDSMLRSCYTRRGRADFVGFIFSFGGEVSPEQAQRIYYRVTGAPFSEAQRPKPRSWLRLFDDDGLDNDRGGAAVGGRAKDLSLAGSRMDQSVDAGAGLSYLEWTLVFKNHAAWQQEARAQIALPPGGVVSRLTLWVNGEEREAAFAARGKVSQAYEQVVRQRRDPALVTTSGPDRVLLQCFPVPPNGGEMKVRIGVTAPIQLELEGGRQAIVRLPYFKERNFHVSDDATHSVWVESRRPLGAWNGALKREQMEQGYVIRGTLKDSEMVSRQAAIRVLTWEPMTRMAWAADPHGAADEIIIQTVVEKAIVPPSRVVIIVDGSAAMREAREDMAEAMSHFPAGIEVILLVAADEVADSAGQMRLDPTRTAEALAERVREIKFEGGRDNVPALLRAWDVAAEKPGSAIVWVHGPQPVLMRPVDELRQRWERRPAGPLLFELQVRNGPNMVLDGIEGIPAVKNVPRLDGVSADLARLFAGWNGAAKEPVFVRERVKREKLALPAGASASSSHLARLWARDEVMRLTSPELHKIDEAIRLAAAYQLVTPVTGAVVLERKDQYEAAGLEPVKAGSVPTIPEPEEWLLIMVVAIVLTWALLNRRRVWKLS
jgi:hypothetical protein